MGKQRSRAQKRRLNGPSSTVSNHPPVHQIKGGTSHTRQDGTNHTGNRKPTQTQLDYLNLLRQQTGSTKTHTPDTRLEASDEIALLLRRQQRR